MSTKWKFALALGLLIVLLCGTGQAEEVLVSDALDAAQYATTQNEGTVQDLYDYVQGQMNIGELNLQDDPKQLRVFRSGGDASEMYALILKYVEDVCASDSGWKVIQNEYESFEYQEWHGGMANVGEFSFEITLRHDSEPEGTGLGIWGSTLLSDPLYGQIFIRGNFSFKDCGLRADGNHESTDPPGESLGTALYRLDDGSYATDDGRFIVRPGEAVVYLDGEQYATTDISLKRNRDGNQEDFRINYYYRNDWIRFAVPFNSLLSGDMFDKASVTQNGRLLEICHSGESIRCQRDGGKMTDAAVRVMYWDVQRGEAVVYVCAEFDTTPYTVETVACFSMGETLNEPEAHATYTMLPYEELEIPFDGTEFDASPETYEWEILKGSNLIELTGTRSQTCTVKAWEPGEVRIKVTYHYWKDGENVLLKTPERQPASKAREYVINILPEQ